MSSRAVRAEDDRVWGISLALAIGLAACGGARPRPVDAMMESVKTQAAAELGCPFEFVSGERMLRDRYRAEGCGAWVMYLCRREPTAAECSIMDRGASATRSTWSDASLEVLRRRLSPLLASCLPPGRDRAAIEILITPDGSVSRAGADDESSACMDQMLMDEHADGMAVYGRRVTWEIEGSPEIEMDDPEPEPEDVIERPPGERARSVVDALAPRVRRCTDGAEVTFQLSWRSDGRLDVLIAGDPERERCIRAIVSHARIAPTGRAGTITYTVAP